jgi:signal transduction histidine kinase/CheY-like chemotaxis protein/HPt (histidine-containing phosphotransfer) domain-containing protein
MKIRMHPPWFLSWVAFFFYISAGLLFVLFWATRQKQREAMQLQYQSQLEADVRSRTHDLRRANDQLQVAVDEIGQARQEAVQANQAKSEFLAALSHEIRTPMHGVLGMTDLLLHSGLRERQSRFAESAHASATELLSLIDNILDFSKIEAGKLELEETTLDLREVIENICYLYGEMAQAKNIELNLIFNPLLQRQLYGDPVRLRQVIQNLLSNAIKFTKRGSVNVYVDEVSRGDKRVDLRISVEDTGIGMDSDAIDRIFEAFSQADSSTTRQYGGTGLGLSIAKQLVELMNGKLNVSSTPGAGTTMSVDLSFAESPIYAEKLPFSLLDGYYAEVCANTVETRAMLSSQMRLCSVPVRECERVEELSVSAVSHRLVLIDVACLYDNADIAQVQNLVDDADATVLLVTPLSTEGVPQELRHLPHTHKPCRTPQLINDIAQASREEEESGQLIEAPVMRFNRRVLIVEDMAANQEIARAMLESFGCSVELAKNGDVALEMYQHNRYDIILMDCQMPVMDGFEATRHIRQLEAQQPGNTRLPIVAVTAGKTEVEKNRCYAAGMDRILFKPYSTAELNSLLSLYFEPEGAVSSSPAPRVEIEDEGSDIVDVKALDNIRGISPDSGTELLRKVFENFKDDVEAKVEELRGSSDGAALGAGAHAIKSMSLNIGAKALSEYCRVCEKEWKAGNVGDSGRELEVLYGHYQDAVNALSPLIEEPDSDQELFVGER